MGDVQIAVLGTLDTKGEEHAFVADHIRDLGATPILIDVGTLSPPQLQPDHSREEVLNVAGMQLPEVEDRGARVAAMAEAAPAFLQSLVIQGKVEGVISLGGGGGTSIGTAAMRALPLGFPKVMVSTLAGGDVAPFVGISDIVMVPAIVDVAGLNSISRGVFSRAAAAIVAMAREPQPKAEGKSLIAASMFGNTTDGVNQAREFLAKQNFETLVFHATGTGGRTMEALIEAGHFAGVLDITTTEWADELCGGVLSAGPTRLEAAGKTGTPAVIVPGCLDMVNFGPPELIPEQYKDRLFYHHNPQVTLMRTNAEECAQLGVILAEKLNAYTGKVAALIPAKGISLISEKGGPFHNPQADEALFSTLEENLSPNIPCQRLPETINSAKFSIACTEALLAFIQ